MLFWLIIIAVLIGLWFLLAPRMGWSAQRTRNTLGSRLPFLRGSTNKRREFKAAVQDAVVARGAALGAERTASLQEFSAWLNALSDKELKELSQQVNDACRRAEVNPDWLFEGRAHGEMERSLQDTLLLSSLAMWRARSLEPFARLEAYRQNPHARGNREFGQQVFARLVETQNIALPASLVLAPEKERSEFADEAIEKASQENQDAVIAIVREVIAEPGNGKKPAPASVPQPTTPTTEPQALSPGA
jgi:hypothetical protein